MSHGIAINHPSGIGMLFIETKKLTESSMKEPKYNIAELALEIEKLEARESGEEK